MSSVFRRSITLATTTLALILLLSPEMSIYGQSPATSGKTPSLEPGTIRTDDNGVKQVYVPTGCFMMGSDPKKDKKANSEEQPLHEVCLTQSYWIDQYEVTNAAYQKFIDAGGYRDQKYWSRVGWQWVKEHHTMPHNFAGFTDPQQPRVGVTWYEANAYARWRGGKLPTEAQWEYAARGPESHIYTWGDTYDKNKVNDYQSKLNKTANVGSYPSGRSWVGADDMAGNVWEWVADHYGEEYYEISPKDDPTGSETEESYGLRGGSWFYILNDVRSAFRNGLVPGYLSENVGFRIISTSS